MPPQLLRTLRNVLLPVLLLLLIACGDRGKGDPPEQKRVVIGSAAQIQTQRARTHLIKQALPAGVTHKRFKAGVEIKEDAPQPFILSSGNVFLRAKENGLAQVAFHEDLRGRVSAVTPHSFHVSDTAIVSRAVADPTHPNAVLVTLTGKKGNSYITSLDSQGNAISKFMVLSAEPQKDVLVITDPEINPILCSTKSEPRFGTACDYLTSTDFNLGHSGAGFSMDAFLKVGGTPSKKYILFDAKSIERLTVLNNDKADLFNKRAIYFENIDTLFVMEDGVTKLERMALIGKDPTNPADLDPYNPSLWFSGLSIHHVATQEEFNGYVDFGGNLSSSPLRDFEQVDELVHEITPGRAMKPRLVGVQYSDGSEQKVSLESVVYLTNAVRLPVVKHIFEIKLKGDDHQGVRCYVGASFGLEPKISLNSFKSTATVGIGGDFKWNGGKAAFGVHLKPAVDVGGQIAVQMTKGISFECSFPIREFPVAEIGIPIFGNAQIIIPIEAKTKFGLGSTARGNAVLVTPKFNLGKAGNYLEPGETGFSYAVGGGVHPDYSMQATLSRSHLGLAEGTNLSGSHANGSNTFNFTHQAGVSAGLEMRAKVKTWIFSAEVEANLLEAMIGFKTDAEYDIDTATDSYLSTVQDAKSGIGLFLESHPSVSVKTRFFSFSFNLFDLGGQDIFFLPMKYAEAKREKFEPADHLSQMALLNCSSAVEARFFLTDCSSQMPHSNTRDFTYSSQQISFGLYPLLPGQTWISKDEYLYQYIYLDKGTGKPVKVSIPAVLDGEGQDTTVKINKYGVTDILAESIRHAPTTRSPDGRESGSNCWLWFKGDERYQQTLQSCI